MLLLSLALACAPLPQAPTSAPREVPTTLEYRLALSDPTRESVRVELTWVGEDPLGLSFADLGGIDPEPLGDSEVTRRDGSILLRRGPGEPSAGLAYEVFLTRRQLESVRRNNDEFQCSYMGGDHAMVFTEEVFLRPQSDSTAELQVAFDLPEGWSAHTPWVRLEGGSFQPANLSELCLDVVALGHWTVQEVELPNFRATFAVAPGQAGIEELIRTSFPRVMEYELELFGRSPCSRYLFVFGQIDLPMMGGSPRTRSMTMVCHPSLLPRMATGLAVTVAHEFHHVWVMQNVRGDGDLRWMNEGFTDYFAHLVGARLGLTDWDAFATKLGDNAASCMANSLCAEKSLAEVGPELFFQSGEAHDMTYAGGFLIAAWVDRCLRRDHDRSLDEFMRWYVNEVHAEPGDERYGNASTEEFARRLAEFADEELAAELMERVTSPFTLDPVELFEDCDVPVEVVLDDQAPGGVRVVFDPLPWREHASGGPSE